MLVVGKNCRQRSLLVDDINKYSFTLHVYQIYVYLQIFIHQLLIKFLVKLCVFQKYMKMF